MAEQPLKGIQAAKPLKPSRLRNEVRLESVNDEKSPDRDHIQVPHSDTIVQETQLDSVADYGTDDGLDTLSQALIERNKANKAMKASPPSPLQIKMLSREALGCGMMQPSSSTSTFSFGQARKVPGKTHFKAVSQAITQATIPDTVEQGKGQSLNVSGTNATPVARPHRETKGSMMNDQSIPVSIHHTEAQPCSFEMTKASHYGPNTKGLKMLESSQSAPPSAQPEPIAITKKIRVFKNGQKGRKPTRSQQRSNVWPPRSSIGTGWNDQASIDDLPMPHIFATVPEPSPIEPNDAQTDLAIGENADMASIAYRHSSDTHDSSTKASQTPIDRELQHEIETMKTVQYTSQMVTSKMDVGSSQSVIPAQSSIISDEQPPTTVPKQSSQTLLEGSTAVTPECASQLPLAQDSMESQQEANRDCLQQINGTPKDSPTSPEQASQLLQDSDAVHAMVPPRKEANLVLHKPASQDSLHRVTKPRKRIRAPSGPTMHYNHGPSIISNFDRSLDQLRTAFHADQLRLQHDHNQTAKQHEETTTALQDLVGLQNNNIAEWKEKHQDLRDSLIRLTDKAKTNQKYATGLQNDYEKLQKSAIAHHDRTKRILQEKIREVEQERDSLQKEFEKTLVVLERSQKNLKATAEDLYTRLVLSDSKKKDLAENLSKQTALYEAECKKREDLQEQLCSTVKNMQSQLSDLSAALVEKVENVQPSIDDATSNDSLDPRIEECLKTLQSLQTAPFLTSKDVAKAEGMLRFVHERLDAGLEALSSHIKNKHLPTDEIKTFIRSQLDILRADQLKYDGVVSENLKASEANKTLKMQLHAQEKLSQDLEDSIKGFQQKEIDLKARLAQLESELHGLKVTLHDHEAQPSELEQKTLQLRQRAEKAEDGLAAAQKKTEQADRLHHQVAEEVVKHKKMYDACKAKLLGIAKQIQCQQKATESFAEMCTTISKEYQKKFDEKESGFKNDIHRLTVERDDSEAKYRQQLQQAKAAKNQMHDFRNNIKALNANLQVIRGEKDELQMKLKNGQQTAQASPRGASEIASLKERLQQKVEEIDSVKQDHATRSREHADLRDKSANLQSLYDQSQAQVAQHLSTIKVLRRDSAAQLLEAEKKARIAVQVVQDQASTLQKEKDALVSELEQAQSNKTKLNEAQNNFSTERNTLELDLFKLRAAGDVQAAELIRVQAAMAEEKRRLVEGHHSEVEDWSHRLKQSDTALKEAEAQVRRMEAEHRAKLESDKKETASVLQLIEKETEKAIQKAWLEGAQSQQQALRSTSDKATSTHSLQSTFAGNNRKKVSRENRSVLNAAGSLSSQFGTARYMPTGNQLGTSHAQRQDSELGNRNAFGSEDLVDSHDLSLVDAAAETVPETQLTTGPAMALEAFDEDLSRVAPDKLKSRGGSSTELSDMDSEDLTHLEISTRDTSTRMLRGRDMSSSNNASDQKHRRKPSVQIDDISMFDSGSSQPPDRPRSQANTASRMMPPPEFSDQYSKQRNHLVKDGAANVATRHALHEKPSQNRRGNTNSSGASSPDFMYTHQDPRLLSLEHSQVASQSSERGHTRKRKASVSPREPASAPKKQRTPSHPYPAYEKSGSKQDMPSPSGSSSLGSRSNAKPDYTEQAGTTSGRIRSKTQLSSSSIPPRKSGQGLSSSEISQSRARDSSSPRSQVVDRARRSSVRLTKNRSRGSNGVYEDRFGQELGRR